jgi:uncharacterized membrane protein
MGFEFETSIEIAAPAEQIWSVWMDVERWPEWTASVSNAKRLDPGAFGVRSRVKIWQPKLVPAVWQVVECAPGQSFVWESKAPGVRTLAAHRITVKAVDPPSCRVVLTATLTGLFATLLRSWIEKITGRYVEMEAQGLKRRCEEPSVR